MCVKVLGKGLMLLDLGLNRIILTGMLRTEHGDTGGDRDYLMDTGFQFCKLKNVLWMDGVYGCSTI